MSGAVIIRRCASAEEAAIVCALLNDAGIPASLENWHHAMIDWGVIPALSGVGVRVPAAELEAARAAIIEYATSAEARLREEFPDFIAHPLFADRHRLLLVLVFALQTGLITVLLVPIAAILQIFFSAGEQPVFPWGFWIPEGWEYERAGWLFSSTVGTLFAAPIIVAYFVFVFLTRRFLARRAEMKAHP
jgi:hypothetical protein